MKNRTGSFSQVARALALALTLVCCFAYLVPGKKLRAVAAQGMPPTGSFGFLINSSFGRSAPNGTGLAILGVMNFDGAGNVTGPYTYEVDANQADVAKTTTGTFTGTYSSNSDGTGSVSIALHGGISLTLSMVASDGGQSLQLVATDYQFPALACFCNVANVVLAGIARAAPAGSMSGSFGLLEYTLPNANATIGVAKFDGAGNVTQSITFVGSSDDKGQPTPTLGGTLAGTYSVNPDGTGTISFPAVPGVSNSQTYSFVVTDNGSGLLVIQTDRRGNGVLFGTARMQ